MLLTDYLERNARLWGMETALVEINPSEERDKATTWREFNLIESANPDAPYRRELSWTSFDRRANRFANLLLSRGIARGTKVACCAPRPGPCVSRYRWVSDPVRAV